MVRLRFENAEIPPRDRGGREWDDDGSGPDSVIRIYRDGQLVYESEPTLDDNRPQYDFESPNLFLPSSSNVRFEMWEQDTFAALSVIGSWSGRGLPNNTEHDAIAHVFLDNGTTLRFRVLPPTAERGTGIGEYEVRGDGLALVEVYRFSPAGRAGLRAGDVIVEIDGERIADLGEGRAAGALSMASSRRSRIHFSRNGTPMNAILDGGYVWRAP